MPDAPPIPPWLRDIEGEELPRLINSNAPIIRVIAGPGSGKTLGLKRRVQRLVEGEGVLPKRVFVGTFTRAIARELEEELGVPNGEGDGAVAEDWVQISTLHSYALQLVRENPPSCPGRTIRFLLGFEKEAMLYDIGEQIEGRDQRGRKDELNRVCAAWAEGAVLEQAGFVGALDRWLRRHGAMLIEEVVNMARIGLESGSIPPCDFEQVIIDEYQDLTAAEQQLVEKLWSQKLLIGGSG